MYKRLKQTTATLALILSATFNAVAQPYGQSEYINANGNSYILSDALYSKGSFPGYIMVGYDPTPTTGDPNFVIYRTGPSGTISGTSAWANGYEIHYKNRDCHHAAVQINNTAPIAILESTLSSAQGSLFVAIATDSALFYAALEFNGNDVPTMTKSYPFPHNIVQPTKPNIVELSTGDFIISGSYTRMNGSVPHTIMYLLKIDSFGNIILSNIFDLGVNTELIPNSMAESPYGFNFSKELVIVGKMKYNGSTYQGFVLSVDYSNFALGPFSEFGTPAGNDALGSIVISNGNPTGFAIGGIYDEPVGGGHINRVAFISLDPDVVTTNVSSFYTKNGLSSTTGILCQVIERPNTYASGYDLFLQSSSTTNLDGCIKLEPNGNIFSQAGNTNSDFQFWDGNGSNLAAISYNNVSGNDEGLHLYGNSSSGGMYLVQAYFNGAVDCSAFNRLLTVISNSSANMNLSPSQQTINTWSGLVDCFANLNASPQTVQIIQICGGAMSDPTGNNARKTSLDEKSLDEVIVYPNPANSSVSIRSSNYISYQLYSIDGKLLQQSSLNEIPTINLSNGIYILKVKSNQGINTHKLIIQH